MTLRHGFLKILPVATGVFLLFAFFAAGSWGREDNDTTCKACHAASAPDKGLKNIFAELDSYPYKHPITSVSCEVCHIQASFGLKKVWELNSIERQREQVFYIKDLAWDRAYDIDARLRDSDGKTTALPIRFVPSEIKAEVENDFAPPQIADVRVVEVLRAVFTEAVIEWATDEPATSIIEFGLNADYGQRTGLEGVFANGHVVRISGLKAGKPYHFRAVSRDIFGNTSYSKDFTVDTGVLFKTEKKTHASERATRGESGFKLFKSKYGKDVYLRIESARPVAASLSFKEAVEKDKHGFGLTPPKTSHINSCAKCHSQAQSHPVGVRGDGVNVRIPPELPTVEGGMMTCITCHYPHGGQRRYFARIDMEKDFCGDCHIGKM